MDSFQTNGLSSSDTFTMRTVGCWLWNAHDVHYMLPSSGLHNHRVWMSNSKNTKVPNCEEAQFNVCMEKWTRKYTHIRGQGVAYFNVVYVQCINKCFNKNICINAGGFWKLTD